MLQRAASNACSWWWASHIRTKQSKWLEQSLQDMEDKVQSMIKLIEEDGDSFAKRAEMYYKRRPELISSVEEAYRSFKALADRYDLMSKELQNANHTIATVFPEQVQFSIDDEDDDCPTPKIPKNAAQISTANIPKVPKVPVENLKGLITTASQKFKAKKSTPKRLPRAKAVATSGLSKEEALDEIGKLHKEILSMQTIKEFVKSSYESGLAKYWEIENQIMEKQDKVCRLQDEFEVESVIEDNEARTLMAEAALKSCQETLASLQEKQENATREAREEYKKIEEARLLLTSIKSKYMKEQDEDTGHELGPGDASNMRRYEDTDMLAQNAAEDSEFKSLTVTELAEKIDDLVNKVINLETAVSSQTVLINTMRTESDELHSQIRNLEGEKETLIGDTHSLSIRVKELEEKLNKVQDLNRNVESQNSNLHTNFAEARSSLGQLSEKLSSVKPDEEVDVAAQDEPETLPETKLLEEIKDRANIERPVERQRSFSVSERESSSKTEGTEDVKEVDVSSQGSMGTSIAENEDVIKPAKKTVTFLADKSKEHIRDDHPSEPVESEETKRNKVKEVDDVSWQQMLLSGTEDKEKILLKEYTAILRNYKDVKKKLSDTEKKDKDLQFDMMVQMRELKEAILKRDQEIQHLRQKLNHFQEDNNEGGLLPDSSKNQQMKPQSGNEELDKNEDIDYCTTSKEDEIKLCIDTSPTISPLEEKLREEIDAILDENLEFWLRFSTSYHEVQKFKSEVKDLQGEISKLNDKKKQEGNATNELKSEARPLYKHLREIQAELTVWSEHSASLKEELKRRFSSLCRIQEEITKAMSEGLEEGKIRFSSYQAAKLQGEILSMKQENNKVREELQSRFDHVSVLQLEIEKTVTQMNEEFGIATDQPQLKHSMSRSRVPLRSFIFGTKTKKQKHSLFSFMHHNRKFQVVRAGLAHSNNNS